MLTDKNSELSDWDVEVISAKKIDGETVFTLRTHQLIVNNQSKVYSILSKINAGLLVISMALLIGLVVLSIILSIAVLDNLHIIDVIKTQNVPGLTRS